MNVTDDDGCHMMIKSHDLGPSEQKNKTPKTIKQNIKPGKCL